MGKSVESETVWVLVEKHLSVVLMKLFAIGVADEVDLTLLIMQLATVAMVDQHSLQKQREMENESNS